MSCPWCGKETQENVITIGDLTAPIIEHMRPWEGQSCPGPQISAIAPVNSMDLVEWLRAQLAEDERVAFAAGSGEWKSEPCGYGSGAVELANPAPGQDDIVVYDESRPTVEEATHIARWHPSRVLAEVKAKRAVLAGYEASYRESDDYLGWEGAVHAIAQVFAGREGWQDEWSVG
jgi:hypothetical protein